jgi:hypothetical protein
MDFPLVGLVQNGGHAMKIHRRQMSGIVNKSHRAVDTSHVKIQNGTFLKVLPSEKHINLTVSLLIFSQKNG